MPRNSARKFTRSAGFTPTTLDREKRTVEVVALSGAAPVDRDGPAPDGSAGGWIEELDAGGADLAGFPGSPVLRDHRPNVDDLVGVVAGSSRSGARVLATVRFSTKPAAEEVFQDVAAGILRGVSLGYAVEEFQFHGRRDGRPVFRAVQWTPKELSFTPMPADAGATVRSKRMPDGMTDFQPCEDCGTPNGCARLGGCVKQAEDEAGEEYVGPSADNGGAGDGGDSAADGRSSRGDEGDDEGDDESRCSRSRRRSGNRAVQIRSVARAAGLSAGFADTLIDRGASVTQARAAAFTELERRGRVQVRTENTRISVGESHDDPDRIRSAMASALAARTAPSLIKVQGRARQYMGYRALDMVGELASARGERINIRDQTALLKRAIGSHGASDFPLLLQDAGNKILLAQYQAAEPTYRQWAAQRPFTDFKPHKFLRVGDFPGYQNVQEAGEVNYGTLSENRELVTAREYATGVIIGRKALINDDLSALADFSMMIAVRTAADENAMVYQLLASNPVMSDGNALFHANHGNLAAVGTAIDVPNVGKGRAAMRKQTGLDGIKLNIEGSILLVGPDKETEAAQMVAAITPHQTSEANPWANRLTVVVDANISGNAWHLVGDPAMFPVIVYGYVSGAEGPQIKTEIDFDTQAVKVRSGLDFGCGVIDFRGVYKNPGN